MLKSVLPLETEYSQQAKALTQGLFFDVFGFLGIHKVSDKYYQIRVFKPGALAIELYLLEQALTIAMVSVENSGLFIVTIDSTKIAQGYQLQITYPQLTVIEHDVYSFPGSIEPQALYLFCEGNLERAYRHFGCQQIRLNGVAGSRFAVWAPDAQRVSVIGDFNAWDNRIHVMRRPKESGLWELFIPELVIGSFYKFDLLTSSGACIQKADPFAFRSQLSPDTASIITEHGTYHWQDAHWMSARVNRQATEQAILIYELHLGSWKHFSGESDKRVTYKGLVDELLPYIQEMGFTHIQFMPLNEFPFDGSWGYQPIGLFAATARFGHPDDLRYFIDCCHQAGIGVLLDWVPGHFPCDSHGLAQFDGSYLYEHADPRQGFHPDWQTLIYNYQRHEVKSFLLSNALYWLDEFHFDGLRVDAVASMLYLDYSRDEGEWLPNHLGGRENLAAVAFIQQINKSCYRAFPGVMMIAEESTSWPGVTQNVEEQGLGFGFKWNMGWMNDSLSYMAREPVHRRYHHQEMTFSLMYAFSENFILALSHDEVVHGKRSLLEKMPGDDWQKFANLRAYYGFMWAHPGKKLLFMGGEFAQRCEWQYQQSLDWHLLTYPAHQGIQRLVKSLNQLVTSHSALYQEDHQQQGFQWINAETSQQSVFSFCRSSSTELVLVVSNMTPHRYCSYRLGVPHKGDYRLLLNTDAVEFGGSGALETETDGDGKGSRAQLFGAQALPWDNRAHSIELVLPPLATVFLQYCQSERS